MAGLGAGLVLLLSVFFVIANGQCLARTTCSNVGGQPGVVVAMLSTSDQACHT